MSANSLLVSQASAVSGVDTAGALARMSGDSANVLPSSELSLVQTGGKRKRKTMRRKTKARKSMWYSGGRRRKSRSQKRRR